MVVEDGQGHTVHITTFVESLTEEKRNEIYAVEAEQFMQIRISSLIFM